MKLLSYKNIKILLFLFLIVLTLSSCKEKKVEEETTVKTEESIEETSETLEPEVIDTTTPIFIEKIKIDMSIPYATYSVINEGEATLYRQNENFDEEIIKNTFSVVPGFDLERFKKNNKIVVAVNAGHGTKNKQKLKTYSHPDFSPKVSGGTTKEGSIYSSAISDGMTFLNGMLEADANLLVATKLKDQLLIYGYSVLMLREDEEVRLDNVARTVLANEYADLHVAIHFDSTDYEKGIFFVVPYTDENYLNMEPLKDNALNITNFGKCIINSFKDLGEKIWHGSGMLLGDLTQISYSTNPSVDIELGDRKTNVTEERALTFALGIKNGVDAYVSEYILKNN